MVGDRTDAGGWFPYSIAIQLLAIEEVWKVMSLKHCERFSALDVMACV